MLIGFQMTAQQYVQSLNQFEIVENANWHSCKKNPVVYHLITSIRPSPFEMHVCKCLGQIFKRGYLILGATDDTEHIIQDLSQHPQLPLQHTGRIYCLQMGSAQSSNSVQEAACSNPWKMMAPRSQVSPYSRLQALCLVNILLGSPSPGPSAGLWHLYANPSS